MGARREGPGLTPLAWGRDERPLLPSTPLQWTRHPAADTPGKAGLAAAFVVGFSALTGAAFQGVGWAALSLALLFASTSAYWFPTRYRIDDEGVGWRRLGGGRYRGWRELRRIDRVGDSWLLSTFSRPSRLDRIRGIHLPDPPGDARALIEERVDAT